jgi:hypothetical protein
MEPSDDITKARDARMRKRSGWLVATIVFMLAYAIFISSDDYWGLALGWFPSTFVAAAFGWLAYCFPWLIDAFAILLDLIQVIAAIFG